MLQRSASESGQKCATIKIILVKAPPICRLLTAQAENLRNDDSARLQVSQLFTHIHTRTSADRLNTSVQEDWLLNRGKRFNNVADLHECCLRTVSRHVRPFLTVQPHLGRSRPHPPFHCSPRFYVRCLDALYTLTRIQRQGKLDSTPLCSFIYEKNCCAF